MVHKLLATKINSSINTCIDDWKRNFALHILRIYTVIELCAYAMGNRGKNPVSDSNYTYWQWQGI